MSIPQGHLFFGIQDSISSAFSRNENTNSEFFHRGPEIGIGGGGYFGPWAQNASACDTCVNNVLHTTFDSRPIIQKYCNIQIGRFQEAVLEMIKQAENETASQGFSGFPHLLNYTLGSPGIPAFEDIPDIPF